MCFFIDHQNTQLDFVSFYANQLFNLRDILLSLDSRWGSGSVGEILCLKLDPNHFSNHLIATHDPYEEKRSTPSFFARPNPGVPELCYILKNLVNHNFIENVGVFNSFYSV